MNEKLRIKINNLLSKLQKYGAMLPVLFFFPFFLQNPTIAKCQLLAILIVYYYLCFMGPVYFIKFLISKLNIKQKWQDPLIWISGIIMYVYTVFNWIFVFLNKSDYEFASAIFLIPFIVFLRIIQIVTITLICVSIFNYMSKKLNKKEEV